MHSKVFDFTIVSSATWESDWFLDQLLADGRATILKKSPWKPGGLGPHGHLKTRCLGGTRAFAAALGLDGDGDAVVKQLQEAGVNCDYVERDPSRPTTRKTILQAAGSRLILEEPGSANWDSLDPAHHQGLLSLLGRSRAVLCGNVPFGLTRKLALRASQTKTFFVVNPGMKQLNGLSDIPCDLLACNVSEARKAVACHADASPAQLFEALCQLSPAKRIIQTGGGEPAYLLDRAEPFCGTVAAANLSRFPGPPEFLNACGSGDVAASGVVLGLLEGLSLVDAFAEYGRKLATAHLLGKTFASRTEWETWRKKTAALFPSAMSFGEIALGHVVSAA